MKHGPTERVRRMVRRRGDSLVDSYRRPDTVQEVNPKANLGPDLCATLMRKARAAKARIAGYEPARYVIAPEPGERLLVYVEPRGFSSVGDLGQGPGAVPRSVPNPTEASRIAIVPPERVSSP